MNAIREENTSRSGFRVYLLVASVATFLLSLRYIVRAKGFAFADVGIDTLVCFYPLQMAVSRQLHELHTVTWSFDLGLGGFLGTLFDPLWLVTGWLPETWQLQARLPMFCARVLLGGGFFYGYLRLIGFRAQLAIVGGLAYAFSSYGMINAQWEVMHGTEFVQFSAFLYFLEKYLRGGTRWSPIFAGVVIGIGHPMSLYMLGLFALCYACARLTGAPRGTRLALVGAFLRFAGWSAAGLMITAPLLFPALFYLLESPRVSGDHSQLSMLLGQLFSINPRPILSEEISGLLGKDLLGTGAYFGGRGNYFEAPGFYVGMLPLLCVAQLFGPHASRRERYLCVAALAAIAAYFIFPALRSAVYGFGASTFRFSTLWISALLLVLGLAGLRRALVSEVWVPGVAIGTAAVLVILAATVFLLTDIFSPRQVLLVVTFVGVYAAYLVALREMNAGARVMIPLIAIFACELILFAAPSMLDREVVALDTSSSRGSYYDGTQEALSNIQQRERRLNPDNGFYRIDKTYYSVYLDDALIQDYSGTASYFFHATSVTRFVDKLGLPRVSPSANYIDSMIGRRDLADVLGIKYVLSKDRSPDAWRDFSFVDKVGKINIYQNNTVRPLTQFYDTLATEPQADALPVQERSAFLLGNLVVSDPAAIKSRIAEAQISAAGLPELKRDARLSKLRDDELAGTVSTPTASALLLAMPFDIGWEATLDGKALGLVRADYGLTATVIPAGPHTLTLHYSPPGRLLGWWIAASVLALLLILRLADYRAHTKASPPSKAAASALHVFQN